MAGRRSVVAPWDSQSGAFLWVGLSSHNGPPPRRPCCRGRLLGDMQMFQPCLVPATPILTPSPSGPVPLPTSDLSLLRPPGQHPRHARACPLSRGLPSPEGLLRGSTEATSSGQSS